MKWVGWIVFFLIIIGLIAGGFFLTSSFDNSTFEFKEVEILDYDNYSLNDFVEQDVICNDKTCTFKGKNIDFTISEIKKIGYQDVLLKLEYEGESFEKTFHVNVVDKREPEIFLSKSAIIVNLNENIDAASYIVEVKDNYDILNINDIKIENNVDLKKAGDYEIVYSIKDSSDNKGKATLKVKVKGEKEVVPANNDKIVTSKKVILNYNTNGLFNDSGNILEESNHKIINKNIELNWDNTLKVTASITDAGKVGFIISKNETTGNELSAFNGALPQISSKNVEANESASFEYTFLEEGTYYVSIIVWDENNDIIIKKDYCLNLINPSEVKDMKIIIEEHESYLTIDSSYIGGPDSLYFDAAISDTNDSNIAQNFVYENDEIRLYYKAGCYYEILGALIDTNGNIVLAKTIKIQK